MTEWANLRVTADTMEELEAYRLRLDYSVRRWPMRYPLWIRGRRVSLGEAVQYLLHGAILQGDRHHRQRTARLLGTLDRKASESSAATATDATVPQASSAPSADVASADGPDAVARPQGS